MTTPKQVKIYGIKSCDTMKKAFTWLDDNDIAYVFHDFKKETPDAPTIQNWIEHLPLDSLINKRGTTWRKLDDETKQSLDDKVAVSLIQTNASIVKRPLLEVDGQFHLGFKADQYGTIFNQ